MNLRETFLKTLNDNEDDTNTRLAYADWLDEHGEHEEADRQRKWPAAKEWLVQFCCDNNPKADDEYPSYEISYTELLKLAREAIKEEPNDGELYFPCGDNEQMCDSLRENCQEFWKNWSIVTGISLPSDVEEKSHFSCAC